MCMILPPSESRFCARKASGSTTEKLAPSPLVTNMLPSGANLMSPTECDRLSEGMQSKPAGKDSHDGPTQWPRTTNSLAFEAVSPETVYRAKRPVFELEYWL